MARGWKPKQGDPSQKQGEQMEETKTEVKELALGLLRDLHKDMLERQVQENVGFMKASTNFMRDAHMYAFQTRAREMDELQLIIDTLKESA